MNKILKTTNLCKSFNGQEVVNNISLNIEENSIYGLLGPNGAGKSTILKMITGILSQPLEILNLMVTHGKGMI